MTYEESLKLVLMRYEIPEEDVIQIISKMKIKLSNEIVPEMWAMTFRSQWEFDIISEVSIYFVLEWVKENKPEAPYRPVFEELYKYDN